MQMLDPEKQQFLSGKGNWTAFDRPVEEIFSAAEDWKRALAGVDLPWLCWNVDPDWCLLQQKLVLSLGWTPVVGSDPRATPPIVLPESIAIDFNQRFGFPTMYPHFPLEFVFLYADRLAFWHSDLLCRFSKLTKIARMFEQLPDGEMAAVPDRGGIRNILNWRSHRYWELIGCVTRGASKDQFDNGCGWWMEFQNHPNSKVGELKAGRKYYWDYGVGIAYWRRHHGGVIHPIDQKNVAEGHFTRINNPAYKLASPGKRRNLSKDLSLNFELSQCASSLGLESFLQKAEDK